MMKYVNVCKLLLTGPLWLLGFFASWGGVAAATSAGRMGFTALGGKDVSTTADSPLKSVFEASWSRKGQDNRHEACTTSPELPPLYNGMLKVLDTMQKKYYTCALGEWPDAIDWTAEVVASQVSTGLSAISDSTSGGGSANIEKAQLQENVINRYFTHITSFYFGEDAFGLRTQAYDDMLWVVLNWIEAIRFVDIHSKLFYEPRSGDPKVSDGSAWYARQFVPQFAHRARLFYDLASRGWDTTLCGGGMVWNPRLAPYKNAITNELYITASIWMYLYFPGDDNASPFSETLQHVRPPAKAHDPQYLSNAVTGYDWLKSSKMRNGAGLYVDGFHVRGWRGGRNPSNGTGRCDLRAEKVYTYNQGVVLSGLRGLWEATGNRTYLEDGHELIRAVISASGWADCDHPRRKWDWAGLGRGGVLEEECDWSGQCNQDGQTFKGIFFWHFSQFCSRLPTPDDSDGWPVERRPWLSDRTTRTLHRQSCEGYEDWVKKNAEAAWSTRDRDGLIGNWWGRAAAGGQNKTLLEPPALSSDVDYRNNGVPYDEIWRVSLDDGHDEGKVAGRQRKQQILPYTGVQSESMKLDENHDLFTSDLNDRGRGRTVETQSGGVSVLRAAWRLEIERRRWHEQHP